MIENIKNFFLSNPQYAGLIIAAIGLVILLGGIFNWNWMLADKSAKVYRQNVGGSHNLGSHRRRAARDHLIARGVIVVAAGIAFYALFMLK
ncbi:MAG: hypothetical protein LBS91_01560 [Clostridiales Family XIII bacterium]|jgi:hypothetical protein|nr:hypothetical protein [Clostridiales Family XIII bacterium]